MWMIAWRDCDWTVVRLPSEERAQAKLCSTHATGKKEKKKPVTALQFFRTNLASATPDTKTSHSNSLSSAMYCSVLPVSTIQHLLPSTSPEALHRHQQISLRTTSSMTMPYHPTWHRPATIPRTLPMTLSAVLPLCLSSRSVLKSNRGP